MVETIARIRIELQDLEPNIWRSVDVPVSSTLVGLHRVIQAVFGWRSYHLFEFVVGDRRYGEPAPEYVDLGLKVYHAKHIRLRTLLERGVMRFTYVYDFGDDWNLDITIEEIREGAADIDYPVFVAGERRCPPEDVGSSWGFMNFLEAALDPTHKQHAEVLNWYGKPFDLNDIDERRVRMRLKAIARRRRGALARHRSNA